VARAGLESAHPELLLGAALFVSVPDEPPLLVPATEEPLVLPVSEGTVPLLPVFTVPLVDVPLVTVPEVPAVPEVSMEPEGLAVPEADTPDVLVPDCAPELPVPLDPDAAPLPVPVSAAASTSPAPAS
jgi:hypothetical protein